MTHDFKLKDVGNGMKICMITCPLREVVCDHSLVSSAIRVLEPLAEDLFIISSNCPEDIVFNPRVHIRNVKHDSKKQPMMIRVAKQILWQLRVSFNLIKLSKNVDIVIFYLGSTAYPLPAVWAKLLRKKIVSRISGSPSKTAKEIYRETLYGYGGFIFSYILNLLERMNHELADRIVVESESQIREFKLERYKSKVQLTNCFFNSDLFNMEQDFGNRRNLIGFIGGLGEVKGVMNFVKAIPLILNRRDDVEFLIGGHGHLREKIEDELRNDKLYEKVTLAGWIPHAELIHYYNDVKLLVVPSYAESIPIVAIEAMACGTPVLATPVGGVPDVINDEENGFILKDNSPQSIADGVLRALEHPGLDEIARAAYFSVESGFTYQAATEKYRIILNSVK